MVEKSKDFYDGLLKAYKENPCEETSEAVIAAFSHMIQCYHQLLTTGRCEVEGRLPWFLRRFVKIVNMDWLVASLQRYDSEDIRGELILGLLETARDKDHIVYAYTYKVKQIIRRLTKDPSVRTTDYGEEEIEISSYDELDEIELLAQLDLTPEQMMIVQLVLLKGATIDNARRVYNDIYKTKLNQKDFRKLVAEVKETIRYLLLECGIEDGSTSQTTSE